MSALDQIVSVSISQQTAAVPVQGFGIPLIMGSANRFANADLVRAYTGLDGMVADGFLTSDPEYILASKLLSQPLNVTQFLVGKRSAKIAQVNTLTPDVSLQQVQHFTVTIDGVLYDFTSDATPTAAEQVTGLSALINADPNCAMAATGANTLILTAKNAGQGSVLSCSGNLANVLTTSNNGLSNDIIAIRAKNDTWYALCPSSTLAADLVDGAQYIETQKKVLVVVTGDAAVPTTATNDVISLLKGRGYKRTLAFYSANAAAGLGAGLLGQILPLTPGSYTCKFKSVVGISPDVLTDTQRQILIGSPGVPGKNCNIFETVGGQNIVEEGVAVGGQFFDITIGLDWLQANMQAEIYSVLVNAAKVPYTDAGSAMIESAVRTILEKGIANGLIDGKSPYSVTVPPVLSVSQNQRANRVAPTISWSCRLAGAYHFVVVQGVVTV